MLKIAILSGSSRPDSQSGKVATYLKQQLQQRGEQACVLDLAVTPLPLWPAGPAEHWPAMQAQLAEADALVVIAPEWHGMACPAVKNFFLYASKAELAHKPALLVGVSSGIGGAYPISELRASGYKNCRLCYLPEHLIIRQVEQVLNAGTALDDSDQRIRARIDYALDILCQYGVALAPVRANISFANPDFANGM